MCNRLLTELLHVTIMLSHIKNPIYLLYIHPNRETSLRKEGRNVVLVRPDMNISIPNGTFDRLNTTVFMDFYTTIKEDESNNNRNSTGRFLIEYRAGIVFFSYFVLILLFVLFTHFRVTQPFFE